MDISDLSNEDLIGLLSELEESDPVIEKMASDGSLDYWDRAGRLMAHAQFDEMNKLAGGDEIYDLDDISAEDLLGMIDSGEFEIVGGGDLEKEAGRASAAWESVKGVPAGISKHYRTRDVKAQGRVLRAMEGRGTARAAKNKMDTAGMKQWEKFYKGREAVRKYSPELSAAGGVGAGALGRREYVRRKKKNQR
jgi:hypothetical protein